MIILLAMMIARTSSSSVYQLRGTWTLQVTVALDWPRHQVNHSAEVDSESHTQQTQHDYSESTTTPNPDDVGSDSVLDVPEESLILAQDANLVIRIVVMVFIAIFFSAFVMRCRHEIQLVRGCATVETFTNTQWGDLGSIDVQDTAAAVLLTLTTSADGKPHNGLLSNEENICDATSSCIDTTSSNYPSVSDGSLQL
jgi:hypothetical protein